jgi:drug/metabolite transporter (DMT)-like permease
MPFFVKQGKNMRQGVSFGVVSGALWGTVFLAPAFISDFSAIETSAARFTAYGLVSLIAALPRIRTLLAKLEQADLIELIKLAFVGNLLYYFLLSTSVHAIGIAPTSLIIGTLPVSITLLGRQHAGAPPLRRLAAPLLLILTGIVCVNVDVFSPGTSPSASWVSAAVGVMAAIGALASWTWFAIANSRALRGNPRFSGNDWSVLSGIASGALGLLVWAGWYGLPTHWRDALGATSHTGARWQMFWVVNIGLAIGASWLGNALWNAASRRLPTTLMGQMIVFETVFALLYGFIYDARLPRSLEVSAICLLMIGVWWSVRVHIQPGTITTATTTTTSSQATPT